MKPLRGPSGPTTKSVGYAYPTSPNAVRFGYSKAGCWTVSKVVGSYPPEALAGFRDKSEAEAFAATLPYAWDKYSAHTGSKFDHKTTT